VKNEQRLKTYSKNSFIKAKTDTSEILMSAYRFIADDSQPASFGAVHSTGSPNIF